MLAPNPVSWFFQNTKVFPAITIDSNSTDTQYNDAIHAEANFDSGWDICTLATSLAVFPPSLSWHVFAQAEADLARFFSPNQIPDEYKAITLDKEEVRRRLDWILSKPELQREER